MRTTHTISTKQPAIGSVTTATLLLLVVAGLPASAAAEAWELQTAAEEVPGTRYIEAGQLDKGIRLLERTLKARQPEFQSKRGPTLTNLCMAYTLKRDYEKAAGYCDQAVARDRLPKTAHNNRGVLRALQGDYQGAMTDFRKAGCLRNCPPELKGPASPSMNVARRNLIRAEERYVAVQQRGQGERLSQTAGQ